jgi:hypothetical protein
MIASSTSSRASFFRLLRELRSKLRRLLRREYAGDLKQTSLGPILVIEHLPRKGMREEKLYNNKSLHSEVLKGVLISLIV